LLNVFAKYIFAAIASGAKAHIYVQLAAGLWRDCGGTVEGLKAMILGAA
jgi:hypothetical protein